MNISLANQQKLCQCTAQIIAIAKKYNIKELWVIPPVGWVEKKGQIDLMFSYDENEAPSISDIVEVSLEIEEVFKFNFKIVYHDINNIITAASKASDEPYYGIFVEAINSAIPLDMIVPTISLAEQLQNSSKLTMGLSGPKNGEESYLFQFQKMGLNATITGHESIDQEERKNSSKLFCMY